MYRYTTCNAYNNVLSFEFDLTLEIYRCTYCFSMNGNILHLLAV